VAALDVIHRPGAYLLHLLCATNILELHAAQATPVHTLHRHGGAVLAD
jgi:hypothetical protein